MISPEVKQKLDEKISRDCIAERDAGQGRKLSYLEGWYVIDRLNQVIGQGKWAYDTEEMRLVHSGEGQDKYGKPVYTCHYVAKVCLSLYSEQYRTVSFSDYGYGDGSDKQNIGKAHELAVKEAVTDGIKRCAKNLGMSMGLALYDKTQENVSDEREPTPHVSERPHNPAPVRGAPREASRVLPSPGNSDRSGDIKKDAQPSNPREDLEKLVNAKAKVVVAQKKDTPEGLKAHLNLTYKVAPGEKIMDQIAKLSDAQVKEFLNKLETLISKEG